jgi:sporulation protein YlmC with PRC-barrel domain
MGKDKMGVDPAGTRVGQLLDVQFARREQHLAQLAINHVAVDVRIGKCVMQMCNKDAAPESA